MWIQASKLLKNSDTVMYSLLLKFLYLFLNEQIGVKASLMQAEWEIVAHSRCAAP